jgi:hypothetical protein
MFKKIPFLIFIFFWINVNAQEKPLADSTDVKEASDSTTNNFNIPIFSTSGGDVDNDLEQQDVSSLLMSSKDVFTQFSSFQFGAGRYRMRGYMAENQLIMINGVNVNNLETGFSSWSNWGGLNDVTRYTETRIGNGANRYNFSGPGGYTNIDSKASSFRKGTRISYANANRIFRNRVMITHSTGMMENGWALTLSASTRQGNQVYVPGTYFRANSFYASIDKNINDKHLISFTGFGSPIEQGRASSGQKEDFELTGTHYYNNNWGLQDGQVRNAAVSKVNRPMLMLSHIFNISTTSKLSTTIFYNFGKSSYSNLTYNNALWPRPDYYRYLPSYYYQLGDTVNGDLQTAKWENDVNTRQINWDRMIAENRANLFSIPGQGVNTTETRGRYLLQNSIENLDNKGFNMVYNSRFDKLFLSAGINANIYRDRKYKEVEDLLGATYWLDEDNFAQNVGVDPMFAQNNIEEPNKKIYKGDRFGYDYAIHMNRGELWGQAEYNLNSVDMYLGLTVSNTGVWREGFMQNGKFPERSKGTSEKLNFLNYGVKGGITYKINGRHFLTANGTFLTRNPETQNVFVSPQTRNDLVPNVKAEQVLGGDLNYMVKYPGFKFRATYYYTQINQQTWLRTIWSEDFNAFINYIMTGVNQTNQGIELGIEKILFTSHVLQGAFGFGKFIYTNTPVSLASVNNIDKHLFDNRTVYWKNYHVGGSPQLVSGFSYRYNGKKFWNAGLSFNYFDQIYVDMNPDRRTEEAVDKHVITDYEEYHRIIDQERLPAYYTVNFNAGKSFRISQKYFLSFNFSINNLLNNKNIISSGTEQLRWDPSRIEKFPNRYYYMQGLTYQGIVNFSF